MYDVLGKEKRKPVGLPNMMIMIYSLIRICDQVFLHMYLEECHDDGCQEEESQDTDGDITVLDVISCRCRDTTIELVDEPADETTPEESDSDVARIVDTQIQTGVAVDERPSHKEESEHALSY